jgi:DNA polymerase-3 subunit alpha
LIKAGAFDSLGARRSQLFAAIDRALEYGTRRGREREIGQFGLFATSTEGATVDLEPSLPDLPEWPLEERLAGEKETLGFYVTGHPLERYAEEIALYTDTTTEHLFGLGDVRVEVADGDPSDLEASGGSEADDESLPSHLLRLRALAGRTITIAGIVTALALKTTKRGDRFAIFTLEDQYGSLKVLVWPETFNRANGLLREDALVVVRGKLEAEETAATLIAEEILTLEELKTRMTKLVIIRVKSEAVTPAKVDVLYGVLDRYRGSADVLFEVECAGGVLARIRPNPFVKIAPSPEALAEIRRHLEGCEIRLVNGRRP